VNACGSLPWQADNESILHQTKSSQLWNLATKHPQIASFHGYSVYSGNTTNVANIANVEHSRRTGRVVNRIAIEHGGLVAFVVWS
jgi:hypothetical protein